jgi:hypothetical protein
MAAYFSFSDCAYALDDVMVAGGYKYKFGEGEFETTYTQAFAEFIMNHYEIDPDAENDDGDYVPAPEDEEESTSMTLEESGEEELQQD